MASFNALKAAGLPACSLNNYVEPHLLDDVKPIHMIVTTPDRFDTCYQKQVSTACVMVAFACAFFGCIFPL